MNSSSKCHIPDDDNHACYWMPILTLGIKIQVSDRTGGLGVSTRLDRFNGGRTKAV